LRGRPAGRTSQSSARLSWLFSRCPCRWFSREATWECRCGGPSLETVPLDLDAGSFHPLQNCSHPS
jgi:hypothetical protein